MLRITASASATGAKKYFGEGLVRSDYYIDGQEVPGLWGGKGAERLGLSGQVDQAGYFALCDNRNPIDGSQLTPRQKDNRRVGFDFTFSAPKTVSVAYELSGDERILDAFRSSVKDTMSEMETEMKTRVRKGANEDRVTSELTWAEFVHFTSRPVNGVPDPHLHAHMYAFNATYDDVEQRWKSGQFGDLKRDAPYFQAAFDARLAKRLERIGFATVKTDYSFELAGVAPSVVDTFSQRRNAIERTAAAKGITTAEGKHEITRRGREKKSLDLGREELRREWDGRLSPTDRASLLDALDGRVEKRQPMTAAQAMDYAVEHVFERNSTLSEKRLKAEALRFGVGSVLPEDLERESGRTGIIRVDRDGQTMTTTRDVLSGEVAMLAFAREGAGRFEALGDPGSLPEGLSAEQGAAAAHVLQSRDAVVAIRGAAGTGKTHMMKATIAAIEHTDGTSAHTDRRVFVFAPSAQASRGVLRDEGFKNADTLQSLLTNEKLQDATRGQVIWVDEAGLVSNRDMRRLFEIAKRNNNRVVLSGDDRQMSSVQAGDAFRLLESEAGVRFAELRKIRRQKPEDYRKAVEMISDGTAAGARKGFAMLDDMGAVVEAGGDERHQLLVKDYLQAVNENRSALIIAPTHAEGDRLTRELRVALKARGELGERDHAMVARTATRWTTAQKRDSRNYESGMVVEFQQNVAGSRLSRKGANGNATGFSRGERVAVVGQQEGRVVVVREDGTQATLPDQAERFEVYRTHELKVAKGERLRMTKNVYLDDGKGRQKRLNNGEIVTVTGFSREGDLHLDNGLTLPKTVGHVTGGYVETGPSAQGKTVDRVFIAAGDMSLPAMNAKTWYVSASRGRDSMRLYVDNKDEVREAIARSGSRLAAIELVRPTPKPATTSRLREMLEGNRIVRYLRNRADGLARSWQSRGRSGVGSVQHA